MKKEDRLNIVLRGIGVILLYFISTYMCVYIPLIFRINYYNLNIVTKTIYLIIYDVLTALLMIYIYRKDFITSFKDYKKNISKYLDYIWLWIGSLILMIISNMIIVNFTVNEVATNQQAAIEELHLFPIYLIVSAAITGPIIEEIVFRLSIRKIINNNTLFIITSGLVFGLLHVVFSYTNITDFLYIIPYSIPGFAFAYMLVKTKNICVPISMHILHNSIMLILQIIALIK